MKKVLVLLFLCVITMSVSAQSSRMRSFFRESYVLNYFKYAHPNARNFNGAELYSLSDSRAVVKVSFDGNIGSTYVCTIFIDIDSYGNFLTVTRDCDSPTSWGWSCFDKATTDLRNKCRNMSGNSSAINMMERRYGKSISQFSGCQLFCTLLNILWYNY